MHPWVDGCILLLRNTCVHERTDTYDYLDVKTAFDVLYPYALHDYERNADITNAILLCRSGFCG